MKKMIALISLFAAMSSFAVMPTPGHMICGRIERDFDSITLFSPKGIFELSTYDTIAEMALDSLYTGDSCCVTGEKYGAHEIIVDKVLPSVIPF